MLRPSSAEIRSRNFTWALKPLLVWTKCLAIDLGNSNSFSSQFSDVVKSKCFTVLGFSLLLVNLTSQIITLYFLQFDKQQYLKISSTSFVARVIHAINFGARNIGIHLCLLVLVRTRWSKLWKSLKKLESSVVVQSERVYHQCRIFAIIGTFYILSMV